MLSTVTAPVPPAILTDFDEKRRALFGHQPIRLGHSLHRSPLFSREGLAELIDRYPRDRYNLIQMGPQGATSRRFWTEGDKGDLTGEEVIAAIEQGRIWINLRDTRMVDSRYQDMLDQLFSELEGNVPGLSTFTRTCGILISSPKAQVYYHLDLPGQSLWQITGRKRVYVYPNVQPFLAPEDLENVAIHGMENDITYHDWYDDHAEIYDIGPGEALHWPLNAPHRVENHDCLNVSMTVEYWTEEIRRSQMLNVANGILRQRFGLTPKERTLSGLGFWSKAVLQRALKHSRWVKREKSASRPLTFRLDRRAPGGIAQLPLAAE